METMDSYGLTCKGGPGPYVRRARHSHEEDQAQGAGTATRRTELKEAYRWLPLRGSRDKSQRNCHWSKEKEECIGNRQAGPEEEEQCRRRRSSVEGGDTTQEAQGCQASRIARRRSSARGAPVQYSMKKVLSGERAGAASLATL